MSEIKQTLRTIKLTSLKDVPRLFTGVGYYLDFLILWFRNGELHREDGPALEFSSGIKDYYLNGKHISFEEWFRRTNKGEPQ